MSLKNLDTEVEALKKELRENLISKLEGREKVFEGIYGFDENCFAQI